jgi:hypothetical protein
MAETTDTPPRSELIAQLRHQLAATRLYAFACGWLLANASEDHLVQLSQDLERVHVAVLDEVERPWPSGWVSDSR